MERYPPIDRLTGDLLFVALKAALVSYTTVVRTGVVPPAEVEQFIDGLTDHIKPSPDATDAQREQVDQMREAIEAFLLPHFAKLRDEAAQHWRG